MAFLIWLSGVLSLFVLASFAGTNEPGREISRRVIPVVVHQSKEITLQPQYISSLDGDTILVSFYPLPQPFQIMPVRLFGIQAPELHSKIACEKEDGLEAKRITTILLTRAKSITLEQVRWDKYARLLAVVRYDGINLADRLLEERLAVPYYGEKKKPWKCRNGAPK